MRPNWWGIAVATLGIALLAAVMSPDSRDSSAAPSCPFTIDFSGLPHGTILGEQYASQGVHISGTGNNGGPDALIVFDTNLPPTHDPDLAIDIGNIALFALNLSDSDGDGLVDDPDENNFGGTATFAFDQDVTIGSIKWIDKDAVVDNFVIAYDAAGNEITRVLVPLGANSSVQTIPINADGVRRLVFDYDESGGFTGIEVDCETSTPTPTSTSTIETPVPTPTPEEPTPTPSAQAQTPTPSPTPATATETAAPPTDTPAPSATVLPAGAPPQADTSVAAGPGALPAGGGPEAPKSPAEWAAALMALMLVLGGSAFSMRRQRG
jgi:hypothetical protein